MQEGWHEDPQEHVAALERAIAMAAEEGAQLVCLQELTLSPYFAIVPDALEVAARCRVDPRRPDDGARRPGGPAHGIHVHASLYESGPRTAAWVTTPRSSWGPDGESGREDAQAAHPGHRRLLRGQVLPPRRRRPRATRSWPLGEARFGFPTCWDQSFPELARAYSLGGAEVIVYPTAIGSEPDHPEFDTQPLWERVITGNGIANGTFMVAVNRIGTEPPLKFYGSCFISDPYGRVLVKAPRDEPAVLVADLDLDQRRDWLELFPFLSTRRPDTYAPLLDAVSD